MLLKVPIIGVSPARRHPSAANDNPSGRPGQDIARRSLLREALHHFAAHGAGAAEQARNYAEQAFYAGKLRDYVHWMAICRALDRGMVDTVRAAPPSVG